MGKLPRVNSKLGVKSLDLIANVKQLLAEEIVNWVDEQNITQVKAAALLGVTQPRLSNLMRGRLEVFSTDSLLEILQKAGYVPCLTSEEGKLTIQMILV